MKTFIHDRKNSEICIYEHSEIYLRGSFFKEKSAVNDIIMSHNKREPSFLYVYKIIEIISQKTPLINDKCLFNPENASMELKVVNITEEVKSLGIDNSVANNLK